MSYSDLEDDEPDSLVQSSFVIACAAAGSQSGASADGFPRLPLFESDARAGVLRKDAFDQSLDGVRSAFKRVLTQMHTPLVKAVLEVLRQGSEPPGFFIPGPPRLTTAAVLGVSLSAHWVEQLQLGVQQHTPATLWVVVHARECFTLATALRLVTTRTLIQHYAGEEAAKLDRYDLGDPASLMTLGKDTRVCLFIDNMAAFHYGVLNDLLQAVHSISLEDDAPTFAIVLSAETGAGVLDDKLDPDTLPILEMTRIKKAAVPTVGFEKVMEALFLSSDAANADTIWMNGDVLELLRQQFYERWPSLDDMLSTIEVGLHEHFSRQPLSILTAIDTPSVDATMFTENFAQLLRDTLLRGLVDEDGHRQLSLPVPLNEYLRTSSGEDASERSKQAHLAKLLQDDGYLYAHLCDFGTAVQSRRTAFSSAVRVIHLVAAADTAIDGDDRLYQRPRRLEKGGLVFALLDKRQARTVVQEVRALLRSRSLSVVEELLQKIAALGVLVGTEHKDRFNALRMSVEDMILSSDSDDGDDDGDADGDKDVDAKRLSLVQKRLVREEASTALKRSLGEWVARYLRDMLRIDAPPIPLEEEAWTLSDAAYLRAIVSPAPRLNTLAALNDPAAYLLDNSSTTPADVPDVCRAYQTYQDAGRLINLADWYAAFRQSIQHGESDAPNGRAASVNGSVSTPRKRGRPSRRPVEEEESSEEDDEEEEEEEEEPRRKRQTPASASRDKDKAGWEKADMVQARFALAVHELGRMGFLKRTRRKAEHVLKIVHDLAPVKR